VPILQGKFGDTTWDFEGCGYYWADQCQTRIGYLLDKMTAMGRAHAVAGVLHGRDTATDVRRYAIGYIRPFKHQIEEKIGALLAGDYASLSPVLVTDGTTKTNSVVFDSWALNNDSVANQGTKGLNILDPYTGSPCSCTPRSTACRNSRPPTTRTTSTPPASRDRQRRGPVPDTTILAASTTTGAHQGRGRYVRVVRLDGSVVGQDLRARTRAPRSATRGLPAATATTPRSHAEPDVGSPGGGHGGLPRWRRPPSSSSNGSCNAKYQALTNFRDNIDLMRGLHSRYGLRSSVSGNR